MARPVVSSKNWRYRRESEPGKSYAKIQGYLILAVVIALIGFFVWRILPSSVSAPILRVIRVENYSRTAESQLPFLQNDVQSLQTLFESTVDTARQTTGARVFAVQNLDSETTLANLAPHFAQFTTGKSKDTAIVYIAAQGIAFDDNAYLLGDDGIAADQTGLCPVDQILKEVSRIGVQTKVILLDAGNIEGNLRGGMPINQFVFRLDQAVKQLDDENLWVVCSHSMGERSHSSIVQRQSIFGWAVHNAFAYCQSSQRSSEINVYDFYWYVLRHCQTATLTQNGAVQTPLLMRGRHGTVWQSDTSGLMPAMSDAVVFHRRQIQPPPEPEAVTEETTQARTRRYSIPTPLAWATSAWAFSLPGSHGHSAGRYSQDPQDEPASAAAAQDQDSEQPEAPKIEPGSWQDVQNQLTQPADTFDAAIHHCWLIADALQQRTRESADRPTWSPVDFAPNLWRVLLDDLTQMDLQFRFGCLAESESNAVRRLATLKQRLLTLSNAIENRGIIPNVPSTDSVEDRLLNAWNQFLPSVLRFEQTAQRDRWNADDQRIATAITRSQHAFRDLVFRTGVYVHWFNQHSRIEMPQGATLIEQLIDELDREFQNGHFEATNVPITPSSSQMLGDAVDRILKTEQQLLQALFDRSGPTGSLFEQQEMLSSLLGLPVLRPALSLLPETDSLNFFRRTHVLEKLAELQQQSAAIELRGDVKWPDRICPQFASSTQISRYRLATRWYALMNADSQFNGSFALQSETTDDDSVARSLEQVTQLGKEVRTWLMESSGQLSGATANTSQQWLGGMVVDIADLRKTLRGTDVAFATPLPTLARFVEPERMDFASSIREVYLDSKESEEFGLSISGGDRSEIPVRIEMTDDDRQLVQCFDENNQPVTRLLVPIVDGQARFRLRFQSNETSADGRFATVDLIAEGDGSPDRRNSVAVYLRRPDQIRLGVVQSGWRQPPENQSQLSDTGNAMVLWPFTKHPTTFDFYLENLSGRQRQAVAEFYAVGPVSGLSAAVFDELAPGRNTRELDNQVHGQIKTVFERAIARGEVQPFFVSSSMTLPAFGAAGNRQSINFKPQPPPANPDPDAPPVTPPPDPPVGEFSVNHGIVCRLKVIDQGDEVDRFYWMEFQRVTSDRLCREPVATYDRQTRRFKVELTANDDIFDFDTGLTAVCQIDPFRSARTTLDGRQRTQELSTPPLSDDAIRASRNNRSGFENQLGITINDEPRAFVFRIDHDPPPLSDSRKNIRHEISQVRISTVGSYDDENKLQPGTRRDQSWAFKEKDLIEAEVQVDWPYDPSIRKSLELEIIKPGTSLPELQPIRFTDRAENYVAQIESGLLKFHAVVTDHKLVLENTRDWAGEGWISALIRLQNQSAAPARVQQSILFDAQAPRGELRFANDLTDFSTTTGKLITFRVTASDLTAIERVQLFKDVQLNGRWDEEDEAIEQLFQQQQPGVWTLSRSFAEAGDAQFIARATDLLGTTATFGPVRLSLQMAPAGGTAEETEPTRHTIRVIVFWGSNALRDDATLKTMQLEGSPSTAERKGNELIFPGVIPGKYKIVVAGSGANGTQIAGELEIEVTEKGPKEFKITLSEN